MKPLNYSRPTITQTVNNICYLTNKVFQISFLDAAKILDTFQKIDFVKTYKFFVSNVDDFQITASGYENLSPGYPVVCWITEKNDKHVHVHFANAKNSKNATYLSKVYISKRNGHLRIKINKFNFLSYRLCEQTIIFTMKENQEVKTTDFQILSKFYNRLTTTFALFYRKVDLL